MPRQFISQLSEIVNAKTKRFVSVGTIVLAVLYLLTHFWVFIPRFWQLQFLGHVPDNTPAPFSSDWYLASHTSWWARPIDPKKFWSDRVIWNDSSAQRAARSLGRQYPPIPTHVPHLISGFPLRSRSHADIAVDRFGGPDRGPSIPVHLSDAEDAYWNWFWRTKPKPPETLENDQFGVADTILQFRKPSDISSMGSDDGTRKGQLTETEEGLIRRAREIGVPEEALTESALFWSYVLRQRREYIKWQKRDEECKIRTTARRSLADEVVLSRCVVDTEYITKPLTKEQIASANAWKIAYLKRLGCDNVDDSYVKAYLQVWQIPPDEVYPPNYKH